VAMPPRRAHVCASELNCGEARRLGFMRGLLGGVGGDGGEGDDDDVVCSSSFAPRSPSPSLSPAARVTTASGRRPALRVPAAETAPTSPRLQPSLPPPATAITPPPATTLSIDPAAPLRRRRCLTGNGTRETPLQSGSPLHARPSLPSPRRLHARGAAPDADATVTRAPSALHLYLFLAPLVPPDVTRPTTGESAEADDISQCFTARCR